MESDNMKIEIEDNRWYVTCEDLPARLGGRSVGEAMRHPTDQNLHMVAYYPDSLPSTTMAFRSARNIFFEMFS